GVLPQAVAEQTLGLHTPLHPQLRERVLDREERRLSEESAVELPPGPGGGLCAPPQPAAQLLPAVVVSALTRPAGEEHVPDVAPEERKEEIGAAVEVAAEG